MLTHGVFLSRALPSQALLADGCEAARPSRQGESGCIHVNSVAERIDAWSGCVGPRPLRNGEFEHQGLAQVRGLRSQPAECRKCHVCTGLDLDEHTVVDGCQFTSGSGEHRPETDAVGASFSSSLIRSRLCGTIALGIRGHVEHRGKHWLGDVSFGAS